MKKLKFLSVAFLAMGLCLNLTSCSDDDDDKNDGKVDTSDISLKVGETQTIEATIDITSVDTDNDFVAEIETNGTVYGVHVGETKVHINDKYKISVKVVGNYYPYPDPVFDWGASLSSIKKQETNGTLYQEDDDALTYSNYGFAEFCMYLFDDNGGLEGVGITISSTYKSTVENYLNEHYWGYAYGSYLFFGFDAYDTDKMTSCAALSKYSSSIYMITYIPYSSSDNKSISIEEIEIDPFEDILPIFEAQIENMNLEN